MIVAGLLAILMLCAVTVGMSAAQIRCNNNPQYKRSNR